MTLIDLVFPKLRLPETWSYKFLKSPVSEDASASSMVNVPKLCWNLHYSTFILFIDHFQVNWAGNRLSYWPGKCWDWLLTHWLPMKSILFFRETIWWYQFRWNYLKNTKLFLNFLLHFRNVDEILNIFRKKITLLDFVISKLRDLENVVR